MADVADAAVSLGAQQLFARCGHMSHIFDLWLCLSPSLGLFIVLCMEESSFSDPSCVHAGDDEDMGESDEDEDGQLVEVDVVAVEMISMAGLGTEEVGWFWFIAGCLGKEKGLCLLFKGGEAAFGGEAAVGGEAAIRRKG